MGMTRRGEKEPESTPWRLQGKLATSSWRQEKKGGRGGKGKKEALGNKSEWVMLHKAEAAVEGECEHSLIPNQQLEGGKGILTAKEHKAWEPTQCPAMSREWGVQCQQHLAHLASTLHSRAPLPKGVGKIPSRLTGQLRHRVLE